MIGGDIIIEVLGQRIEDARSVLEIRQKFNALEAGDTFSVVILRAGKRKQLTGTIPHDR